MDAPEDAHTSALQVLSDWAAAFATMDPGAMVPLYSEQALLYGSKAALFEGHDGVRRYFATLRPRTSNRVRFEGLRAAFVTPGVLQLAALAQFTVNEDPPIPIRLTQTLVRAGGGWRIASHHASPLPAGG